MLAQANMFGSTFRSFTKAEHGINWDNSVICASVVCTLKILKTTVARMRQSNQNIGLTLCMPWILDSLLRQLRLRLEC